MTKRKSPLVRSLIDKYRQARAEESRLTEEFERASRALFDLRETKKLCSALLRKEGFDVESLDLDGGKASVTQTPQNRTPIAATTSGGVSVPQPLNATHTVFLILRRRKTGIEPEPGFTVQEIERFGKEDGTPLTIREINKVVWTQTKKKRMEKLEDGRVRLTEEGEKFTNFRRKPAEEIISVTSIGSAAA